MQSPLETYEAAIAALSDDTDDGLAHKHKAVLALTRANSLRFAQAEYKRYGFDKIRHHEDIMALGGRLYKDLFRARSGNEARDHALVSAEKYEAAFKDTKGYYSGINAATMYLLGGVPEDMVRARAKDVLKILPDSADDPETLYYVEATRAEAYLLLEQLDDTQSALRRAWDHDPLNFIAHASTLNQFRMIAAHRGEQYDWLDSFTPPRPVHFAGHLFGVLGECDMGLPVLAPRDIEELRADISDSIQANDIGFGYGALAAGSDILIAEGLIEEGAQLHVTLPVAKDVFVKHSVAPFGDSWVEKFHECMDQAKSVRIATDFSTWPDAFVDRCASTLSMGEAIRQAKTLSVEAGQLLIWDEKDGPLGTSGDAQRWRQSGRAQYVIAYPYQRQPSDHIAMESKRVANIQHAVSGSDQVQTFDGMEAAVQAALDIRGDNPDARQGLHLALVAKDDTLPEMSGRLAKVALPGSILISELAANVIMLRMLDNFAADFVGTFKDGERIFALREIG